jgi:NADH-quinone oxidoreductase subunit L
MDGWIAWIPAALLIAAATNGAVATGLAHRQAPGRFVSTLVGCTGPFLALVLSVMAFLRVQSGDVLTARLWEWMASGFFSVDIGFRIDHLSAVMMLVVTGVGFLIHVYSVGYMSHDPGYARYFAYLNLFMFFMSVLVLGSSLLTLFVGWEGVGLCSYLLIGFWWKDGEKARAGLKAFLVNRIGDFGFMLGILLLFATAKEHARDFVSLEAFAAGAGQEQLQQGFLGPLSVATMACLLLFVGACGKSAQIPLYVWLPDAMAGPTPVSALIHAATMVTAGVYMVARMHFLFVMSPLAMAVVACVGAATALVAATIGFAQNDIKKVLAYSTVSQLGFMFAAAGVGAFTVAIFHVFTHAFFKALLFLGAGSVIHALHEEQDMRKMGGLLRVLPVTGLTMIVGSFALAGVPPFSGFFSKDEILASVLHPHPAFPQGIGGILYGVLLVASFCTAFYTFRLVWMTFFGASRVDPHRLEKAHESPATMTVPLTILSIGAAGVGFLGVPHVLGGHAVFSGFLRQTIVSEVEADHGTGALPLVLIGIAVALAVIGVGLSWFFYIKQPSLPGRFFAALGGYGRLLARAYRVDDLYAATVVRPLERASRALFFRRIDVGMVDALVNFAGTFVKALGGVVRLFQTGAVRTYVFFMTLAAILLLLSLLNGS